MKLFKKKASKLQTWIVHKSKTWKLPKKILYQFRNFNKTIAIQDSVDLLSMSWRPEHVKRITARPTMEVRIRLSAADSLTWTSVHAISTGKRQKLILD